MNEGQNCTTLKAKSVSDIRNARAFKLMDDRKGLAVAVECLLSTIERGGYRQWSSYTDVLYTSPATGAHI